MSEAPLPSRPTEAGPLASVIRAVDTVIAFSATAIAILALVLLFLALGAEVLVRYFTTRGLGWPSEMPSLLFPWLVMGGVVVAAQRGQHISVKLILLLLRRPAVKAVLLVMQVVVAATFFYLAYIGMEVIEITGTEVYPVTGVSAHYAYLSLIAGFIGIGVTAVTTFGRLLLADDPLSVREHAVEHEQ